MSISVGFSSDYMAQLLMPEFANTSFYSEDGANSSKVYQFNWAGTQFSAQSFGIYQFDVGQKNPAVLSFLTNDGFNQGDITNRRIRRPVISVDLGRARCKIDSSSKSVKHTGYR
jgi:hypothetical protein